MSLLTGCSLDGDEGELTKIIRLHVFNLPVNEG